MISDSRPEWVATRPWLAFQAKAMVKTAKNGPKWAKTATTKKLPKKGPKTAKNGQKWAKTGKKGQKRPKSHETVMRQS